LISANNGKHGRKVVLADGLWVIFMGLSVGVVHALGAKVIITALRERKCQYSGCGALLKRKT